jgi:hypothetical protein
MDPSFDFTFGGKLSKKGKFRGDVGESVFFARQLEAIRPKTYDLKLVNLLSRQLIPVDNSVGNGIDVITFRQYTPVGMAKIISDYATDFPRADVFGQEFSSPVRSIGAAYGYNIQEIRKAMQAGVDLEQRRANAARRFVEEKIDTVGRVGDSQSGLLGLLNQANTTAFTVPNGALGTATWVTKTADEILADLNGIANGIVSSTKHVEIPDTIVLPGAQHALISTKPRSTVSDTTILEFFLKTSPWIKRVLPWDQLTGAGAAGKDRMVCYRIDPDALQLVIPQEFEQFPPQAEGMEFKTHCHARCGGVIVYYPLSISYGDGI